MPFREYHTIRAVHRVVKALPHRSWAVAAAAAAPDRPAPPSPVASDTGIPAGPDRSKAGGHIRQHIPQRRRRPTPSRWRACWPADAGSDHVLKRQEPFPPPRGQWPPGPVSVPLRRSLDEGFRQNRAKARFQGLFYFFQLPRRRTQGSAGCSHLALIRFLRRGSPALDLQFFTRCPCCIGLNGTR